LQHGSKEAIDELIRGRRLYPPRRVINSLTKPNHQYLALPGGYLISTTLSKKWGILRNIHPKLLMQCVMGHNMNYYEDFRVFRTETMCVYVSIVMLNSGSDF
jgi:hypothetical protein